MDPGELQMVREVVRPKTPRGDGNRMDPGELQMVREVVRPKTPRGDGNLERVTADGTIETSRQTQNPERGRKPISGTATLREDTPSRQTQNPERGRKHIPRVTAGAHHSSSRQTQN
ncbi:hypothetical protein AO41_04093, partial [Mycobacterium tuberculosis M1787]